MRGSHPGDRSHCPVREEASPATDRIVMNVRGDRSGNRSLDLFPHTHAPHTRGSHPGDRSSRPVREEATPATDRPAPCTRGSHPGDRSSCPVREGTTPVTDRSVMPVRGIRAGDRSHTHTHTHTPRAWRRSRDGIRIPSLSPDHAGSMVAGGAMARVYPGGPRDGALPLTGDDPRGNTVSIFANSAIRSRGVVSTRDRLCSPRHPQPPTPPSPNPPPKA